LYLIIEDGRCRKLVRGEHHRLPMLLLLLNVLNGTESTWIDGTKLGPYLFHNTHTISAKATRQNTQNVSKRVDLNLETGRTYISFFTAKESFHRNVVCLHSLVSHLLFTVKQKIVPLSNRLHIGCHSLQHIVTARHPYAMVFGARWLYFPLVIFGTVLY